MKPDRTKPPKPAESILFEIPGINSFRLSNGIESMLVEKPKLPIIQIDLNFFAGSIDDPVNKFGLANLTSLAIDEGAGNYSALELDNEFEKLGVGFDIHTSNDIINFSILTLKENFERTIELLSLILNQPAFNEADMKREKTKAMTSLIRLSDEPDFLAEMAFRKVLLAGNPYSNPTLGLQKSLHDIDVNDCKYFAENYFTIGNAHLTVVGDVSVETTDNVFNRNFTLKTNGLHSINHKNETINKSINNFIVHKENSNQSEIRVGKIISNRSEGNHFARVIWNSILGGNFISRINLNLREQKGYTYGAHSYLNYFKTTSDFTVSTAVDSNNTMNAVFEIFNEFNKIRESISSEEINFAKSYLIKKFSSMFETYQQISRNLFSLKYHQLNLDYFQNYIDKIQNVSEEEIINSVRREIVTEEMKLVIVGDKNIIQQQADENYNFSEIGIRELI